MKNKILTGAILVFLLMSFSSIVLAGVFKAQKPSPEVKVTVTTNEYESFMRNYGLVKVLPSSPYINDVISALFADFSIESMNVGNWIRQDLIDHLGESYYVDTLESTDSYIRNERQYLYTTSYSYSTSTFLGSREVSREYIEEAGRTWVTVENDWRVDEYEVVSDYYNVDQYRVTHKHYRRDYYREHHVYGEYSRDSSATLKKSTTSSEGDIVTNTIRIVNLSVVENATKHEYDWTEHTGTSRYTTTSESYIGSYTDVDSRTYHTGYYYTTTTTGHWSPIILDMDGNGKPSTQDGKWVRPELDLKDSKVITRYDYALFDIDDDGIMELVEWIEPGDALLVELKDPDRVIAEGGMITGANLFGTADGYLNGFIKMIAFDTNKDGKLSGDELDGLYAWQDLNRNALIDKGELHSLKELGISELRIKNSNFEGEFVRNGKTYKMWDWWPIVIEGTLRTR